MKHIILNLLIIFSAVPALAQYNGGSEDGSNVVLATSQSLGESIYTGGENDGSITITSSSQSLGESIYTGGENDGNTIVVSTLQSLGESIYTGGENDGSVAMLASTASLGESIYTGGENDGSVALLASASSLGESIYTGGENDGNVALLASASSLGESIYTGGENDGSVSIIASASSLGESIYRGGENDGSIVAETGGQSLAENIYKGGEGAGFTVTFKGNTPLPIQLLTFDARWKDNDAYISWVTANEMNMEGYVLERSLNQKDFDSIYYTSSANMASTVSYSFSDEKLAEKYPDQHIFYFRLKQIEANGKSDYSAIATLIRDNKNQFTMTVFPNPVSEELHLNINGFDMAKLEIRLLTVDGKLVKKMTGQQLNTIKISELAAGNYILNVLQNDETVYTQQISVLK